MPTSGTRGALRPLLVELLDLRDRLAAGLQPAAERSVRWLDRWRTRRPDQPESWREGLGITLRRLDRILADRRVVRIETIGRRFDPRVGRVVGTSKDVGIGAGVVVEEVSAGFLWDDELLRAAEVIVNKAGTDEEDSE